MSLKEISKMRDELEAKIKSQGKELFQAEVKELFEQVPSLKAMQWEQYTPYFNDGDPCVFEISGEIRFDIEGAKGYYGTGDWKTGYTYDYSDESKAYGGERGDGFFGRGELLKYISPSKSDYCRVKSSLTEEELDSLDDLEIIIQSNKDVMKSVFGDHVQVTIFRDHIEVDDYDHD